jgi:hypothetical protein
MERWCTRRARPPGTSPRRNIGPAACGASLANAKVSATLVSAVISRGMRLDQHPALNSDGAAVVKVGDQRSSSTLRTSSRQLLQFEVDRMAATQPAQVGSDSSGTISVASGLFVGRLRLAAPAHGRWRSHVLPATSSISGSGRSSGAVSTPVEHTAASAITTAITSKPPRMRSQSRSIISRR